MPNKEQLELLMVEDNPGDVRLIREALKKSKRFKKIIDFSNGDKALGYLGKLGEFKDAHTPDLILLDLNIPGKNGFEVLDKIREDPTLCTIPVVIFSSSDAPRDIDLAYEKFVNCYITKPLDFEQFIQVIKQLEVFWAKTATLPIA